MVYGSGGVFIYIGDDMALNPKRLTLNPKP